jgi:hypothetical protein
MGGREEHCMQKKHVDVEDGLGWIAQYTSRRTPHWDTLSTIFQAFVSKVASNLQVRRAPDWWKDWKSARESTGTGRRLNRSREGTRPRSEPL